MNLAVIGISYKNTEIKIRDKVVFTDTKKMEMYYQLLENNILESVIVSTCNRSEIYFIYETLEQIEIAEKLFVKMFGKDIKNYLFMIKDKMAISYLFQVTSGFNSLVLGEDQILGQISDSLEFSRVNGMTGKLINHIFQDALHCAKEIKNIYRISENPLSISYVGIKLLEQKCGIKDKNILVIGSGKMSELAIKYCYEYQAKKVINCNRSKENALKLKNNYLKLEIIDFEKRYDLISECDIVISATASPHVIIKKELLKKSETKKYFLDLALPRDIDEKVSELSNYEVYDIDSLQNIVDINLKEREQKIDQAKKYVERLVEITQKWINTTRFDPTIKTIQEKVEEVAEQTFELLNNKLNLDEHEKYVLRKTLKTAMQRLMHEPLSSIKKIEEEKYDQYDEVLRRLFNIK